MTSTQTRKVDTKMFSFYPLNYYKNLSRCVSVMKTLILHSNQENSAQD